MTRGFGAEPYFRRASAATRRDWDPLTYINRRTEFPGWCFIRIIPQAMNLSSRQVPLAIQLPLFLSRFIGRSVTHLNWTGTVLAVLLLGCGGAQQPVTQSEDPALEQPKVEATATVKGASKDNDSPTKVFDAYVQAIHAGEWKRAYACLTPAGQDAELFEFQFQLGAHDSEIPKRHLVPERVQELEKKPMKELTLEETRTLMVGLLRDKEAFFVEAASSIAEDFRRTAPRGPLRESKITGNRARGIVTDRIFSSDNDGPLIGYPYDSPIYFSRGKQGWLIDLSSQEEQEKDEQLVFASESRAVEEYYHCPICNSLQGGMYGDKPFKEFSGTGRKECKHDWKEVILRQFKELAMKLHGYRWSEEQDAFWNRK